MQAISEERTQEVMDIKQTTSSESRLLYIPSFDEEELPAIPTTLSVQVPADRNYAPVLAQTEVVYDQLLTERYHKLIALIKERDAQFKTKYADLYNAGEKVKAEEFKRWSDTALKQVKRHSAEELRILRVDYENKYTELWRNLEAQWQAGLTSRV